MPVVRVKPEMKPSSSLSWTFKMLLLLQLQLMLGCVQATTKFIFPVDVDSPLDELNTQLSFNVGSSVNVRWQTDLHNATLLLWRYSDATQNAEWDMIAQNLIDSNHFNWTVNTDLALNKISDGYFNFGLYISGNITMDGSSRHFTIPENPSSVAAAATSYVTMTSLATATITAASNSMPAAAATASNGSTELPAPTAADQSLAPGVKIAIGVAVAFGVLLIALAALGIWWLKRHHRKEMAAAIAAAEARYRDASWGGKAYDYGAHYFPPVPQEADSKLHVSEVSGASINEAGGKIDGPWGVRRPLGRIAEMPSSDDAAAATTNAWLSNWPDKKGKDKDSPESEQSADRATGDGEPVSGGGEGTSEPLSATARMTTMMDEQHAPPVQPMPTSSHRGSQDTMPISPCEERWNPNPSRSPTGVNTSTSTPILSNAFGRNSGEESPVTRWFRGVGTNVIGRPASPPRAQAASATTEVGVCTDEKRRLKSRPALPPNESLSKPQLLSQPPDSAHEGPESRASNSTSSRKPAKKVRSLPSLPKLDASTRKSFDSHGERRDLATGHSLESENPARNQEKERESEL